VDAPRAGRLRPGRQPDVGEHLADDQRDVDDLRPGDAGHRVEVDAQLHRVVEVLRQHRVGVEVDAAEVDHPGEPAASRTTVSAADVPEA
jgi:hypothetical protein